jgi:hypothetical protein
MFIITQTLIDEITSYIGNNFIIAYMLDVNHFDEFSWLRSPNPCKIYIKRCILNNNYKLYIKIDDFSIESIYEFTSSNITKLLVKLQKDEFKYILTWSRGGPKISKIPGNLLTNTILENIKLKEQLLKKQMNEQMNEQIN